MLVVTAAFLLACGEETVPEAEEIVIPDRRNRLTLEQLPAMPEYPVAEQGHLVAVSSGDFIMDGSWPAYVGVCEPAGPLELYTDDLRQGTAVVLHFVGGRVEGTYSVLLPDSAIGQERVAHIGVQLYRENQAFGFRAIEGQLEVADFGNHVSGRFATTIRETQTEILTRYVGVFMEIAVERLTTDYCLSLRADTLAVPGAADDTAAAGSNRGNSS
ncbi:MAG: hypothetical protein AMS18_00525 [Gemmatimonas sp. SG8_17]|nr:MAG: hypothetical protein AMS18_00525 [Gemmatimonas sp. SG8_17]